MSVGSQTSGIAVTVPTGQIGVNSSLLPASADDSGRGRSSVDYGGLDFRLIVDTHSGPPMTINLVASTLQEKAAWCSDIGQVRRRTPSSSRIILWLDRIYFNPFATGVTLFCDFQFFSLCI